MRDLSLQRTLAQPNWLLASIDVGHETLGFVETTHEIVRDAAFLDGRTPLTITGRIRHIPISYALNAASEQSAAAMPDRMLAHISFCGSTLLGRLLQGDHAALCYSEPHILVELATLKASSHKLSQDAEQWTALIRLVLSQIQQSWGSKPTLFKPSNWANTLLPDIQRASADLKWAIIDTDLKDYLIANLRGGKGRLTYTLNLLNHFLSANSAYRGLVLEVERGQLDPMQRLLRLLIIVFETQERLIASAVQASEDKVVRVSKATLQEDPETVTTTVADGLALGLSPEDIKAAIDREMGQHAKDTRKSFHPAEEAAENARLRRELSEAFDIALEWRTEHVRRVA